MNIIIFIIVLSVLVFVHELGHFLFAKLTNTKVHSFAIGFEPTLFKKKVGETTYKLNAIPFGGYVKIHGQDGGEEDIDEPERAFMNKPFWAKIGILIGGVLFNFIFAWIILSISFGLGTPAIATDENRDSLTDVSHQVSAMMPGGPAELAGISRGDVVRQVEVKGEVYPEPSTMELRALVAENPDEPFGFTIVEDNGESRTIYVTPDTPPTEKRPILGLTVDTIGTEKLGLWPSLARGFGEMRWITQQTVQAFGALFYDASQGEADISTLTGPVGLVGLVGEAASVGIGYLLFFTALISINLAVLNLIPFPALDGGRVLFVLIETVTRRKIPHKVENWINLIGFGLLILLMISVTVFDIFRLF